MKISMKLKASRENRYLVFLSCVNDDTYGKTLTLKYCHCCTLCIVFDRKVFDANGEENWVYNNRYWETRENPGFKNHHFSEDIWAIDR